jgi:hypothetical protein
VPDTPFQPGQTWTYDTRPGESSSRARIFKIDVTPDATIIHVGLLNLTFHTPGGPTDQIGHLPIEENALRQSVRQMESLDTPPPPVPEGYAMWREAFDAGKAGVWTVPLKDTISAIETTLNPPQDEPVEPTS